MSSEEATRQYLLKLLRQYNEKDAEYLAGELDAAYLQQRLSELNTWATGWRKSIWGIWFAVGFVIMLVPIASDLGGAFFFAGFAVVVAELGTIHYWEKKRMVYRILAVMSDPDVMTDPEFDA